MFDSKTLFERFSNANFFSRVDNNHILDIHLGLDDKLRKAIEFRSQFTPRKVSGTDAIEINQYTKLEYNTIRFSLCDDNISELFYLFCNDLIDQTRGISREEDGYKNILARFSQWKKMFMPQKKAFLPETEIMGKIGELLFLRDILSKRIGWHDALKSWSGQELTHKDFSYNNTWSEIKAASVNSSSVKISSLEQLDSDNKGELVVFFLEKMSTNYSGITLNKLFLEISESFDSITDKDAFINKINTKGYEYNEYYDDFVYNVKGNKIYLVNDEFPKLTNNNVESAIVKASYELSLEAISKYIKNE